MLCQCKSAGQGQGIPGHYRSQRSKSTLLKLFWDWLPPIQRYTDIQEEPEKSSRDYGLCPPIHQLSPGFSHKCGKTVLMGRLSGKIPMFPKYTKEDIDITHTLMEKLEIYHLRNRQISQLSGGQFQRALNARARPPGPGYSSWTSLPPAWIPGKIPYILYIGGTKPGHDHHHGYHDMGAISTHVESLACLTGGILSWRSELSEDLINAIHGCPVDIIAHGTIPIES